MRGIAQVNSKYFSVFMLSLLIKKKFLCYHFVHFLNFSHTSLLLLIGLNDTFFLKKWLQVLLDLRFFFPSLFIELTLVKEFVWCQAC